MVRIMRFLVSISAAFFFSLPLHAGTYDGLIYEVIVFNRALSADEIADLYTDGINGAKGVY